MDSVVDNLQPKHHLPLVETTENNLMMAGIPLLAGGTSACRWLR